jgi:hypothetical protein
VWKISTVVETQDFRVHSEDGMAVRATNCVGKQREIGLSEDIL